MSDGTPWKSVRSECHEGEGLYSEFDGDSDVVDSSGDDDYEQHVGTESKFEVDNEAEEGEDDDEEEDNEEEVGKTCRKEFHKLRHEYSPDKHHSAI
jgi:hypothetical protein